MPMYILYIHSKLILFLCYFRWSRNGRKLLSAATDNLVCVWNVLSGEWLHTYRFPSPIMQVKYAPRDENIILICPLKHSPLLLNNTTGEHTILPLLDEVGHFLVLPFLFLKAFFLVGHEHSYSIRS